MKVRVSETIKAAFGKKWKDEVAMLIQDAQIASSHSGGRARSLVAPAEMRIHIKLTKKGATVTAQPDFLPRLDECEIEVE